MTGQTAQPDIDQKAIDAFRETVDEKTNALIAQVRTELSPPVRTQWPAFWLNLVVVMALAIGPFGAPLMVAAVFPQEVKEQATEPTAAQMAALAELAEFKESTSKSKELKQAIAVHNALCKTAATCSAETRAERAALQELIRQLAAEVDGSAEAKKQAIAEHTLFKARALWMASSLVLLVLTIATLWAQGRLMSRHWAAVFDTRSETQTDPDRWHWLRFTVIVALIPLFAFYFELGLNSDEPLRDLILTLVCVAVVAVILPLITYRSLVLHMPTWPIRWIRNAPAIVIGLASGVGLVCGLEVVTSQRVFTAIQMDPLTAWQTYAIVGLLTLFGTMFAVSIFTALAFGRCYPPVERAGPINTAMNTFRDWFKELDPPNGAFPSAKPATWTIMVDYLHRHPDSGWSTKQPIEHGLSPSQAKEAIRAILTAVMINLIFGLVVLSLALDVAELQFGARGDLGKAQAGSSNIWLIFVGVCFSLVLALTYALPMTRLSPFLDGETQAKERKEKDAAKEKNSTKPSPEPAPETPTGWERIVTRAGATETTVHKAIDPDNTPKTETPKPADPPNYIEAERALSRYLGATETKLSIIRHAADEGGGFHSVLSSGLKRAREGGLTKQIGQILTLLAPALAGTILSLLG